MEKLRFMSRKSSATGGRSWHLWKSVQHKAFGFSSNFFLCVFQPSPFNSARGRQRARVLFCAQKRKKKTKKEPRTIFLVRRERHARDDMPSQH
jgi:hypothetical protein